MILSGGALLARAMSRSPATRVAALGAGGAAPASVERSAAEEFPNFMAEAVNSLLDPSAREAASRYVRVPVTLPSGQVVPTGFLPPNVSEKRDDLGPVVMLPGFDSSGLEFRRLHPRLCAAGVECYAIDLLGWGFTGAVEGVENYSPAAKRDHLLAFWKDQLD